MSKRIILRGRGPAPAGFSTCHDPKCTAQRDFSSGRFLRIPNHYHPLETASVDLVDGTLAEAARKAWFNLCESAFWGPLPKA